jgi:hypothetical protein
MAKYDLAISFAGEQRSLADSFANRLDAAGYSIFYDMFHSADLWGRDLTLKLSDIYAKEARYCLILLSYEYVDKAWTNFERQNAISRFIREKEAYILCLKIDDVQLPGLPDVIGYLDFRKFDEDAVYKLLLQKLGSPDHDDHISHLSEQDQTISEQIIRTCYRRAIFTKMASEIDMRAMYNSIGQALGIIQNLIPGIRDQALQYVALEIVGALDAIERVKTLSDAGVSNHVSPELRSAIDQEKIKIIRLLLEIRRAARIPIQLPFALRLDHFWGQDAADSPPDPMN